MYAATQGLVTCAWPGCHQPATVAFLRCRPTESIRLAVDGRTFFYEQPAAIVDYCTEHGCEAL